jgi:anthranilate synthase/aminodeoxychorismate synthase-like glutamine amidotransferase
VILVLDNYDSFSFNLVQYVGEAGCEVVVKRNDELTVEQALGLDPAGIIVSPGPGRPEDAGISVALVRAAAQRCPVLGVCLGHQALGYACGATIVGAPELVHGKASRVTHAGAGIFRGVPSPFWGGRYHSLMVARDGLPTCLQVVAETENDRLIMGLVLKGTDVWGVQFHPESILTQEGTVLVRNFLAACGEVQGPEGNDVAAGTPGGRKRAAAKRAKRRKS